MVKGGLMKDDGGPAFPVSAHRDASWVKPEDAMECPEERFIASVGMSLRDWLAARAMQALLTHGGPLVAFDVTADLAYQMADEMIKQRKK
jgi:hypothetical protein